MLRLARHSKREFILQQGFDVPTDPGSESALFAAMQFQPRVIGGLVLAGVALQSPWIFFAVSAALWWSAIVPRWNPFNAVYNYTLGVKRGFFLLLSPPPRLFSEALTGSLAAGIALLLATGSGAAMLLEGVFVLANIAVVFSRSCAGAALFSRLKLEAFCKCAETGDGIFRPLP
jgi:hypothetical protein